MVIAATLLLVYELNIVFILKIPTFSIITSEGSTCGALFFAGFCSTCIAEGLVKVQQDYPWLMDSITELVRRKTPTLKGKLHKSLSKIRNIRTVLDNEVKRSALNTRSLGHQSRSSTTIHVY
jgi:hypothetical protein